MVNSLLHDQYAFRDLLTNELKLDLIGPREPGEILYDAPLSWYSAGILYPNAAPPLDPSEEREEVEANDDLTPPDPGVSLANGRYPSSMAITFAVDTALTDVIEVEVSAGRYEPQEASGSTPPRPPGPGQEDGSASGSEEPPVAGAPRTRFRGNRWDHWRRIPVGPVRITIGVGEVKDHTEQVAEGLQLFVRIREADADGLVAVTTALVNRREHTTGLRDGDSFFQPRIDVVSPDGAACFGPRRTRNTGLGDEELESFRLLHRHAATFGAGHGCSMVWDDPDPSHPDRTARLRSSFLPVYDLPISDSNPDIPNEALGMRRLAEGERTLVLEGLRDLPKMYRSWIEALERSVDGVPPHLRGAARRNLAECAVAASRIDAGIDLLGRDSTAWEAFRLANRAMLTQRARSSWVQSGRLTPTPPEGDEHRWRPFQISFILMCLPGIADASHPDRGLTDLLWFPTGGGKTEAYLGLIAFGVMHRRLLDPSGGGGLTALMRYTLRLLTLQQFERASLLIACLELMRRANEKRLGSDPIGIGLWVGRKATPNSLAAAQKALNKLARGGQLTEGNPVQIHACPWCGTALSSADYWVDAQRTRMVVECPDEACPFSRKASSQLPVRQRGLPVYVVDEEIYRYRPTLLIATVDKFASLPWQERAAELFNVGRNSPPALIVQDELHLISGPLGTLTGLYETAIDHLCTENGHGPKVIASTATIRRASAQGEALFNRPVRQFPPPGLDSRDSFFSKEADPSERGTRRYVGTMAAGASHATLMIRVYAALLQSAFAFPGKADVKDPYWTLVGYFNSLRVLGGARMQVQDDVGDRVELLASGGPQRERDQVIELTSREASSKIPAHLKQMAVSHPDPDAIDVILATNMISVGVDVNRLGLMAVMGQPPSTSEYIQATSRVGRAFPGLVVTVYNAFRSRDRSHYEDFVGYHNAIYSQVEATSVTPFSPRARDRAIHAVVVGLARAMLDRFRPNSGAAAIRTHRDDLEAVRQVILHRVREVDPPEEEATMREVDRFLEKWSEMAERSPELVYANPHRQDGILLSDADGMSTDRSDPAPTLSSLRDVDLTTHLFL
jgi:hypothetical protein